MLRKMLAQKPESDEDILDKIAENENFVRKFQQTWNEKLALSGRNTDLLLVGTD